MNTLHFTTENEDDVKNFMWALEFNTNGKVAEVVDVQSEITQHQRTVYIATLRVMEDEDINLTNTRHVWLQGFIAGFETRTLI